MSLASEKPEIIEIVNRLLDALSLTITSQVGTQGILLRQNIGDLRAHFLGYLADGTFTTRLLECFTIAVDSKVELFRLANVRQQMFLENPVGVIASSIVQIGVVFCLSSESRIITTLTFTSRDSVDTMIGVMGQAFDNARILVAESQDSSFYQALLFLSGSLINHLATVARPLPRMITFTLPVSMPAPALSNYIYYTPERWDEIVMENHIIHPAFCPKEIRGLSS